MAVPKLSIAMPIWRGAETLPATLASIRAQSLQDFELIASADNHDHASAEVVRAVMGDDPRLRLSVRERQYGWLGNLHWCWQQAKAPALCYWQQDDRCDPPYLERLLVLLDSDPSAAVAYSDMIMGERRRALESLTGPPVERVVAAIRDASWIALRGVMRRAMLDRLGAPFLGTPSEAFTDLVLMPRLAREGRFLRLPEVLYHKHVDPGTTSGTWNRWPAAIRRACWIRVVAGNLQTLVPLMPADPAAALQAVMMPRVLGLRGAHRHYQPETEDPLGADPLIAEALAESGLDFPAADALPALPPQAAPIRHALALLQARQALGHPERLRLSLPEHAAACLGPGWHGTRRDWIWSRQPSAWIWVPLAGPSRLTVTLQASLPKPLAVTDLFGTMLWQGQGPLAEAEILLTPQEGGGQWLGFSTPDLHRPSDLGGSTDQRLLGLSVAELSISPA